MTSPDMTSPDMDAPDMAPPLEIELEIEASRIPQGAAIVLADGTRFEITQADRALEAAAAERPEPAPMILFVHGRACGGGGEPTKSLQEAVPKLTRGYEAITLLVVWPGADDACPLGFPEQRARESGYALAVVSGLVARYRARSSPKRRVVLMTHSMGSLVLEASQDAPWMPWLPADTFDAIVINAAASAAQDHARWLDQVRWASQIMVTVNDEDRVLRAASLGRGDRLGLKLGATALSAGRLYVDLSEVGVNHAYYAPDAQPTASMRAVYEHVILGAPLGPLPGATLTTRQGATHLKL